MILAGILFIVGAVFIYAGVSFLLKRGKMIKSGERATAKVLEVNVSTRKKRINKRTVIENIYNCTLEYMTGYERQTVKYAAGEPRAVGDTIEISFSPDKPEQFMTADQLTNSPINTILPLVFVTIGAILLVVCAVAVIKML